MTYKEIFEKGWPECPEDSWCDVLMNCTSFPEGTFEQLVDCLKKYRSGTVEEAIRKAAEESERVTEESKREEELIIKQKLFVKWLKENKLYNHNESVATMNKMFQVWNKCKEER